MTQTTVVARYQGDATAAASRAASLVSLHGGRLLEGSPRLVAGFASPMDAIAFAGALVDDTAPEQRRPAVGVGSFHDASRIADDAEPGQVLADARVDSSTRGRLACGLSFVTAPAVTDGRGPDISVRRLLVPGVHERFRDVE